MNAYKFQDGTIYAAKTMKAAIDMWVDDMDEPWSTDDCSIEMISPESPWKDEADPDREMTVGDALREMDHPGYMGGAS